MEKNMENKLKGGIASLQLCAANLHHTVSIGIFKGLFGTHSSLQSHTHELAYLSQLLMFDYRDKVISITKDQTLSLQKKLDEVRKINNIYVQGASIEGIGDKSSAYDNCCLLYEYVGYMKHLANNLLNIPNLEDEFSNEHLHLSLLVGHLDAASSSIVSSIIATLENEVERGREKMQFVQNLHNLYNEHNVMQHPNEADTIERLGNLLFDKNDGFALPPMDISAIPIMSDISSLPDIS